MKLQRGDIVLLNFPFSGGTGSKVRPALIVQADRNNARFHTTIVAMITSTTSRTHREPTQLLIPVDSPAGQASGLVQDSALKCENLFTVEKHLILRKIGSLPPATVSLIDRCLKAALSLS